MFDRKHLRVITLLTAKASSLKVGMKNVWLISKRMFYPLRQETSTVLTEMMIVIFIFLLIIGLILTLLATGSNAWQTGDVRIQLQQELRKAMDGIVEDMRQAGISTIVGVPADGNPYNSITFSIPQDVIGGSIVWSSSQIQYLRGGLGGRQLLRRVGAADKVLANNIVSLEFRRQAATSNIVEIALIANKTTLRGTQIVANLNFQAKLRN